MRKKEMIAMLLAGGQGSRLGVLTSKVAKPAVAFGGKYRIIDFPLSNCINSGIDTVGVSDTVSAITFEFTYRDRYPMGFGSQASVVFRFFRHMRRVQAVSGIQVQRMPFIRIWNTWNRSIQIMY